MLLGFDIGGTKCAVVTAAETDGQIAICGRRALPTDLSVAPEVMLRRLCRLADDLLAGRAPDAVGISCGGPLDARRGVIQSPPNLKGWDNVPIKALLEAHFRAPARLQNDANACALAEWRFGAGRGTRNMIFLTFGTGLGAGLILDGRLYAGTNGNAGEVGHLRLAQDGPVGFGKAGSFEGFCSGGGLAQLGVRYAEQARAQGITPAYADDKISAKTIARAAQAGDPTALQVYRECGERLGQGLSLLIDLLDPECIVIGSIFARAHELLWRHAQAVIAREALPLSAKTCRVVPAQLGEAIGDYAAIGAALSEG